jgi:hypothetical protein
MKTPSEKLDRDPTLEAIAELPQLQASPDFTRRLLLKLDERQTTSHGLGTGLWPRWSTWPWGVAAALVALTIGASASWEQTRQRRELRGQIRTIDAERRALAADLQQLRDRGALLYLGSDDRTDYLIDLEGRPTTSPARDRRRILPASQVY